MRLEGRLGAEILVMSLWYTNTCYIVQLPIVCNFEKTLSDGDSTMTNLTSQFLSLNYLYSSNYLRSFILLYVRTVDSVKSKFKHSKINDVRETF